jgi:hypothetical protein
VIHLNACEKLHAIQDLIACPKYGVVGRSRIYFDVRMDINAKEAQRWSYFMR